MFGREPRTVDDVTHDLRSIVVAENLGLAKFYIDRQFEIGKWIKHIAILTSRRCWGLPFRINGNDLC
jgi:hypothetical protein